MITQNVVQYGLTDTGSFTDNLLYTVNQYVRLRVIPFNELAYYETYDYGHRRSRLHDRIAEGLDLDRELVEKAFAKAAERFHAKIADGMMIDGSVPNWEKDFDKIEDSFCAILKEYSALSEEERHPDKLTEEELNEICVGLSDIKTPSMILGQTIENHHEQQNA